jgi:hypothetical protein
LKIAAEDWQFAVDGLAAAPPHPANQGPSGSPAQSPAHPKQIWTGTFDSDNIDFETGAEGILASVDLYKATGDKKYELTATTLARPILAAQQRKRTNWDIPLTGFFYADTGKTRLLHFVHRGRQQAHILALTELCQTFPDHPEWMKWYSAVALYADYVKTVAAYTEPYNLLPASIYSDTEYLKTPESRRESFRQQVLNGVPLGKGNYLRLFPVWMDYRGNFGTILPEAQALANAAWLRNDLSASQLATHQLEWIIGRNPFAQSAMWGEGYDFTPLYSPSSGDIVGALPVGIQTREANDVPYWPIQSTWTYKEVWGHPTGRWIWLMRNLYGPSLVQGQAAATVVFREKTTGQEILAEPDPATNRFSIMIPEGDYTVSSPGDRSISSSSPRGQSTLSPSADRSPFPPNSAALDRTFLPGATYFIDLRPGKSVNFTLSSSIGTNGDLTIKLTATGSGTHHFSIRTDNLAFTGKSRATGTSNSSPGTPNSSNGPDKQLTLLPGQPATIEWRASVTSADTPWVIVVFPDDDCPQRQELTGAAWTAGASRAAGAAEAAGATSKK